MNDPATPTAKASPGLESWEVEAFGGRTRGRLKIYLGMCPGVGKTYAMLQDARRALEQGLDLRVGLVETHGRPETEALLLGLPHQARRRHEHRGAALFELDLEALLAAPPKLVLVDELAHSNAPGARHAKRWQDVDELIDAGVDVWTTLNVQHVESRAAAFQQLSGVEVRETVPDTLLERADEIELIDLAPEALLQRLEQGRVYLPEVARQAAEGFFRESNLNALREMALRLTAELVDRRQRQLRALQVPKVVWRGGDRLLVAVGPSPFSTRLVRWTRRLAAAQGAAWVAVHIEGGQVLGEIERGRLERNLALARELGAEVVVTQDEDVARALVQTALRHNATQIVIGKSHRASFWERLRGGTIVDRLLRLGGAIDVYVVPTEERGAKSPVWPGFEHHWSSPPREYLEVVGSVLLLAILGLLVPETYYQLCGLVYLLWVLILGLRVGRGPLLLAAGLGGLAWNYLTIPPRFTFRIGRVEDLALYVAFFISALVAGHLVARIRGQAERERHREARTAALFSFNRVLVGADTLDAAMEPALGELRRIFGGDFAVFTSSPGADLRLHPASHFSPLDADAGAARWSAQHAKPAGLGTDTLPGIGYRAVPLRRRSAALGVLLWRPPGMMAPAMHSLLDDCCGPLALVMERENLRRAQARERSLAESERLHQVLLDGVSHELRTPLAIITAALEQLASSTGTDSAELLGEARRACHRLNRLVGNLLDQSRLAGGTLRPRQDWCDLGDIVGVAIAENAEALTHHRIELVLDPNLPPVWLDHGLTETVLGNLLHNVARHTPAGTTVWVEARLQASPRAELQMVVSDNGPGLPGVGPSRVAQGSRGDGRGAGLGMGLGIARGFVESQGGTWQSGTREGGGARFLLTFPHRSFDSREPT